MPPTKWIHLKSRREKVYRVAARMLQSRLRAIVHFLPLAAAKAVENLEYIHQVRVWTRRADAVLDLCSKLFSKRERKRLDEQFDLLRDAAGSARDLDVLRERIAGLKPGLGREHLLHDVKRRRGEAQKAIEQVSRDLRGGKVLLQESRSILDRLQNKRKEDPFADRFVRWAGKRFARLTKKFFKLAQGDLTELGALHKFRIAGKRLRYALELTGDCFKKAPRKRAYAGLDRLQTQLGTINDGRNLAAEIEQALEAAKKRPLQTQLKRLLAAERRRLAAAQAAWTASWSKQEGKRLQRQLQKCL